MAAFILLLATTASSPTTPQCDSLASTIAGKFTVEDKTTYKKATSVQCQEMYTMYPRDQVVGHTATKGWAEDDPSVGSAGWALVSHGIGEKLFTLNHEDHVVASLASGVVKSGNDWTLTLKSGRKFSDGSPVTATAVMTALQRTNKALNAAQTELGTMTFTVVDDLNLIISTSIPTNKMDVVLANWPFVVYKAGPSGNIETSRVFSGPYAVASTSLDANGAVDLKDDVMDLVPNGHYPDASQRVAIKIKKFGSGQDVAAALKSGEIDMGFNLAPSQVPHLNWHSGLETKSFLSGYVYMGFFNTNRPALSDINVRKALSLAIDRPALALACAPSGLPDALVSGMAATGAFPSSTGWGSVDRQLATDKAQAATLLNSAGWVVAGDGIRTKDGKKLAIDIVYYTFRPDLVTMAPLIQASYNDLGIQATIRINDDGNFMEGSGNHSGFDMLLWAQNTLPAGDPSWFLNAFFRSDNGEPDLGNWGQKNFAQIQSTAIDTKLDALTTTEGDAWTAAVNDAHQAIIDEYPVTFLGVPVWHVGLSKRVSTYEPWGSDYYVIKPDMPASICSGCTDLKASKEPEDNTGLIVAIAVLAAVTVFALISAAAFYTFMKKNRVVVNKGPNVA